MTWKPPAITHKGTDWTPYIKQWGELVYWSVPKTQFDFQNFLDHFEKEPFAAEPRQKNAADFFRMAIAVLAPLTPQQRSVVNDWPTLRKLIDENYFTQEAVRARRKEKKLAARAMKAERKPKTEKTPELNLEPTTEVSKTPLGRFRKRATS